MSAAGLILLIAAGAPRILAGYLGFMLASVAVLAAITTARKISIHCAVASGSVAILASTRGPLVLPGYLLVVLLAWSWVALKDHTVAQVMRARGAGRRRAGLCRLGGDGRLGFLAVVVLAAAQPGHARRGQAGADGEVERGVQPAGERAGDQRREKAPAGEHGRLARGQAGPRMVPDHALHVAHVEER